ncbi:putative GABA permease GabP [Acetobacter nitrogenifigens DSM 23921 = NBRC 105050]|uniref:Putative GABA permease GabP n=2 Tax=Acetobacter nitrogenifigens TaxID=285268 RepID=A0A511X5H2_9PROT|nr:amino acid permease [Acetobacter nitrogenifigens]GEN58202.1 putative GABA permease GabP [Acetobacter nitrogenifigens DSM 23921 = NBRC 105050]
MQTATTQAARDNKASSGASELKTRHISMIAFGGVIGAGLFVGSSAAIAGAGPGVLLTFAFTGALVVTVMRMLGEMLLARPGLGSFVDYIRAGCGDAAGFVSGWLYWGFWVVTVGSEAIAGAILLQDWIGLPVWLMATALVASVALINQTAVGVFGEFEFWLSLIKIACIVVFSVLGASYLFGLLGGHPAPVATLLGHGGFLPHGMGALLAVLPTVLFSMVGSEIATVAAAESHDAPRNLSRVTRTIGTRITLFYVVSVSLILCIKPWSDIHPGQSPFVLAMDVMGVPGAAFAIRLVVLSAVLSCLNSAMFVTARTLRGLALRGEAPRTLGSLSSAGAPQAAVLACSVFGLLAAFSSILAPGTVFAFLLGATGAVMLFIYLLIVVAHLRMRERAGSRWGYSAIPLFPAVNYAAIVAIASVTITMLADPAQRPTVLASLGSALAAFLAYHFYFAAQRGRR